MIALRTPALSGEQIAKAAGVSPAIVSRILNLAGLSRLRESRAARAGAALQTPASRRARIHIGRFRRIGHSPASWLNEKAKSAVAFPKAAIAYYNSLGVTTPPSEPESSLSPGPTPINWHGPHEAKGKPPISLLEDSPRTTC